MPSTRANISLLYLPLLSLLHLTKSYEPFTTASLNLNGLCDGSETASNYAVVYFPNGIATALKDLVIDDVLLYEFLGQGSDSGLANLHLSIESCKVSSKEAGIKFCKKWNVRSCLVWDLDLQEACEDSGCFRQPWWSTTKAKDQLEVFAMQYLAPYDHNKLPESPDGKMKTIFRFYTRTGEGALNVK